MKKMNPMSPDDLSLRCRAEQRLASESTSHDQRLSGAKARALVHELQVHQIELELQNEALQLAQARTQEVLKNQAGELCKLALQLARTEQRERRQLAGILHDHLQQLLVSAKYHLVALRKEQVPEERQHLGQALDNVLSDALKSCRLLTQELSPPILQEGGLTQAIQKLGEMMYQNHGLMVRIEANTELPLEDQRGKFILYGAVRELLFNVVKHAGVKEAWVRLGLTSDDQVRIIVEDRGHGFDPIHIDVCKGLMGGFGLFNLRERLVLLGGHLEIQSAPGKGSQFVLSVPNMPIRSEANP